MDSERINDLIVTFTLTSSPITSIIPLGILYNAYNALTPAELKSVPSFSVLACITPVLFGVFHATMYVMLENVIPRKVNNNVYLRYIVTGALAAVAIAAVYHAWFNVFVGVMKYENPMVCIASVFVGGLVFFYTIGSWIRYQVLYGPAPSSPPSHTTSHLPSFMVKASSSEDST